jgi:hypothetical protein
VSIEFVRKANILRSACGEYEIISMHLHHGQMYAAYRLMSRRTWGPELLGIKENADEARQVCETDREVPQ